MGRRRYTEQQFRDAVADPTVTTIAELCRRLGIVPRGGNYETLRDYASRLDLESDLFDGRRAGRRRHPPVDLGNELAVACAVAESRSLSEAIQRLGGGVTTHNYRRLRAHIVQYGLTTDHMAGQGWAKGRTIPQNRIPAADLFDRRKVSTVVLRRKLIAEGYKEHRCEGCGHATWEGRPIPLELDHVDGDRTNNRLENLRLLCPNCHALTPTYRGRNIGRPGSDEG